MTAPTSAEQVQRSDMPRPSFNVLLNPRSMVAPWLLQHTQADAENSEMLRAFNDCSSFCSSAKFGCSAPNDQRSADALLHRHSIVTSTHPSPQGPCCSFCFAITFVPLALPETSKVSVFLPLCPLHAVQRSSAPASAPAVVVVLIFSTQAAALRLSLQCHQRGSTFQIQQESDVTRTSSHD
jgi:hypothetical protein